MTEHAPRTRRGAAAMLVLAVTFAGLATISSAPAGSEAFPGINGKIVYTVWDDAYEHADLWTMDPDGSDQEQLMAAPDGASDDYAQWSPDGTQIAFQRSFDGVSQIWIVDADGTDATQLTNRTDGASTPTWSPDGTSILFSAWPEPMEGLGTAIFSMNADGSDQTQLTTGNRFDRYASWSPDGTKIAFTRQDAATASQIWLMNPDGTDLTQITFTDSFEVQNRAPSWSPDGTRLTFIHDDADDTTFVMEADGSDQVEITGPGSQVGRWSPDGTTIAFSRWDTEVDAPLGVWTMSPDGSNLTQIADGTATRPAWQTVAEPVEPTTSTTAASTSTSTTAAARAVAVTPRYTG